MNELGRKSINYGTILFILVFLVTLGSFYLKKELNETAIIASLVKGITSGITFSLIYYFFLDKLISKN